MAAVGVHYVDVGSMGVHMIVWNLLASVGDCMAGDGTISDCVFSVTRVLLTCFNPPLNAIISTYSLTYDAIISTYSVTYDASYHLLLVNL